MVLLDFQVENLGHLLLGLYHLSHSHYQGVSRIEGNLDFWVIFSLLFCFCLHSFFFLFLLHFNGVYGADGLVVSGTIEGRMRIDVLVLVVINKFL